MHGLFGSLGCGDDIGPHQVGEFCLGQPRLQALDKLSPV
jgi:hypothetical protein